MDAIITAGGIPKPDDLLYPYTKGKSKALIDVAGKPMIQWVLDAIGAIEAIDHVLIVGIERTEDIKCAKPLFFIPNQGPMLNNIRAGIKEAVIQKPETAFVMLLSSDIPAITGEMLDWAVESAGSQDADIFYSVVPRQVMETNFPESNRTYVRLKDMELCGGDVFIIRSEVATGRDEIWNKLIATRKNIFKQAALIGFDTLILLLLKRMTLDRLVNTISKRLDLKGKVMISPYAEVGMDIDKPFQLEIVSEYLEKRKKHDS